MYFLQAWELHKRGELVELLDTSLNGNFNVDEACRYMKIALLCTQNLPKLRPSMSTVVKMLMGELDPDAEKISEPGLLSAFMGLTSGGDPKDKLNLKNSSNTESSGSEMLQDSSSSKNVTTSFATMTFNSIYDRSN